MQLNVYYSTPKFVKEMLKYVAYVQCLQLLFEQSMLNRPKIIMLFYYIKVPPHFSPSGPTLALTGALK